MSKIINFFTNRELKNDIRNLTDRVFFRAKDTIEDLETVDRVEHYRNLLSTASRDELLEYRAAIIKESELMQARHDTRHRKHLKSFAIKTKAPHRHREVVTADSNPVLHGVMMDAMTSPSGESSWSSSDSSSSSSSSYDSGSSSSYSSSDPSSSF